MRITVFSGSRQLFVLCLTEGKKEGWKNYHCRENMSSHTGRQGAQLALCSTSLVFVTSFILNLSEALQDVHKKIPWIQIAFWDIRAEGSITTFITVTLFLNCAFVFVSSVSYWNTSKKITELGTCKLLVESCISNERYKILYLHFPLDYFNMSPISPSAMSIICPPKLHYAILNLV